MTRKELNTAAGLPVTTWITLVGLVLTLVAAGGKFYANDAVQEQRLISLETDVDDVHEKIDEILEKVNQVYYAVRPSE
jgi:hypothetical protein